MENEPDIYQGLRQFRRTLDQTVAVLGFLLDNGDLSGQTTPDEIKQIVEVWTDINFIVGNHLASDELPKGIKRMDAKATMYGAVSAINSGFDSILTALQTLHGQEAISADYMQEQMEMAEELRAGINTKVTGNRHRTEAEDWHRFGQMRKTTEKRLLGKEANGNLPQVKPKQE